ncbi:MAG: isopentenyl transferase family protein, partial [Angelakisella sp.]
MQNRIPLVAVVGPTASGKTRLAIELAKALSGEIISGDSMQLYQRLSIATAKPTAAEQAEVPHHLIDLLEPWESFSVAQYTTLAHKAIAEVYGRGNLPILAGGTGLYIRSLL